MFEFFLADRLKMTVARMREEMPHAEYVQWCAWHALRNQKQELAMKKGGGRGGRR